MPPYVEGRVTTWDIGAGSQRWPLIIAHRGDVSTAPENTMSAFRPALAGGADGIELDVRLTRDRKLVVFHDWSLKRTSDGYGPVNHYTLQELQSLDVGSWSGPSFKGERPPALDQVFESLPHDYLLNVEMKDEVCPYGTIMPMFERIPGPKALHVYPELSHSPCTDFNTHALNWLRRYLGA